MEAKKKLYIAGAVLIVLVVALGLLTACTSEALVAYEAPAVGTAPTSYTLTVQATKGEAVTRALMLANAGTDQESLDAVWMKSETIDVYKDYTKVGELKPQEDSVAQTSLKGEVSNVAVNDVLTLKFLSPEYANQGGTLEYIAANCDYATASVTVLGIDGTDVTTTGAVFENQQSIVKFTLQDKGNSNAAISATDMTIAADGNTYSIHTTPATNEFFVALPSFSEKAISVAANDNAGIYTFVRGKATIERGKYYTLTMQMDKLAGKLVNLSNLTENYEAKNGDILTGTIDNTKKISIAEGASITLYNASINANGTLSDNTRWAGITCLGNATITLVGTNEVNSCENDYPGIQVGGAGTTLTINGPGSLTSTGSFGSAGIGSGYYGSCGNITITGGSITATGGYGTAGIGSGDHGSCGDISITGGTVYAAGGAVAAGIGSGDSATCGNISITGGTITATGGSFAAGIGSGKDGSCGNITISGNARGSATKAGSSPYDIGPGKDGTCGIVIVESNNFSGSNPMVNLSTLNGNYVAQNGDVLTGTFNGNYQISIAAGASIMLYNASINANGTRKGETDWAGITCLGNATITLLGENVVKGCNDGLCGIQAGPSNTTLTIDGTGSLTATGGDWAAGIGSGMGGECGNISISGGTITAKGGYAGAGIGSGSNSTCGNISISGSARGSATRGSDSPYDIGPGNNGTCGTVSVADNTISGSYLGQPITCTFTVYFQSDGALNNMVKTDKITITCNGKTYTALRADEVGSYIHTGDSVQVDLPAGNNMSLTFTAECTFVTNSNPVGTFSATVGNVTITESSSNLNEVTLVKQ